MCCQFAFHHQFGINTWRSKFEQKTDNVLLFVDPMDKSNKDPDVIDLSVPRHGQYLYETWEKQEDAENWVDINLAIAKGLKFYQTRSNTIILQETLPAHCIKLFGWKLEKSCSKKCTCHLNFHQRSPRNTIGKENWVQNTLNDQKLGNYLEVSNRTNQF